MKGAGFAPTALAEAAVTVSAADISGAEVTLTSAEFAYDGKAKEPAVKVELGGRTLEAGVDYDVSYEGNVGPGTATATVTGKGNYAGSAEAPFAIKGTGGTTTKATSSSPKTGDFGLLAIGGAALAALLAAGALALSRARRRG